MTKKAELEPRFAIPDSTPRSSKTTIVISGIKFYVYGLEEAVSKPGAVKPREVACLFLAHNRTRTHLVTEGIAQEILWRYGEGITGFGGTKEKPGSLPLIAATFDMRNHGQREISKPANLTWKGGNEDHAADLLSLIAGSAQDLHLLITYLPAYLPQVKITRNLVFGVSLGAHTAWRLPPLLATRSTPAAAAKIDSMALVVGSPYLTALLLSRLGIEAESLGTTIERLHEVPYERLESIMTPQQKRRWPEPVHQIATAMDAEIADNWPAGIKMLIQNGVVDPLVPDRFTRPWTSGRGVGVGERVGNVEYHVQENTGHSCTKEMVARIADWLRELLG
ncbi:hypothetical protein BX600DRAFT_73321 [Xylariales sp. PMI_506]|nr:hypothetical protein BX600DRAFT_73321 [Xylariales sp. PMI_506]